MTQLYDIAEIRAGYPFRGAVPNMPDGLYQVVQPKDVFEGGIINEVSLCFTPERFKQNYLLKDGDVLLSSRGEFKAALYKGTHDALASNLLFVLSVRNKNFCRNFLSSISIQNRGKRKWLLEKIPEHCKRSFDRALRVWTFLHFR